MIQVRSAFEGRDDFKCKVEELPGRFKVLHQDMPPALDKDAVHALTPSGKADKDDGSFGLFIIPAVGGQACMLVNYQASPQNCAPLVLLISRHNCTTSPGHLGMQSAR